jgi:hypothetical protein
MVHFQNSEDYLCSRCMYFELWRWISLSGEQILRLVCNLVIIYSVTLTEIKEDIFCVSSSHWPCGLRLSSAAPCLLGLRIRIPLGVYISVMSVVRYRSLRRADHSSTGLLQNVS